MAETIPYGRQDVSEQDIGAVIDVLHSDWLTQGPAVERFEKCVADKSGANHAVAVNSATSALHIACLAAGLGEGDLLWTSPITFVASANCALYCRALVDFVDIDPRTYNLSVDALEEKLLAARKVGRLPKVVIPVHFAGQSCDMERIATLSAEYGFTIIEDASHAIGGSYRGAPIGNCRYSAMTVFSFHPVKIVTTGEGGAITTNREDLHEHLLRLRSHGITRAKSLMEGENQGDWYYEQIGLGFNYRMTDIQAALGTSQMSRLDNFVAVRHRIADRYKEQLRDFPLILPWQSPEGVSALHLYPVRIDRSATTISRRQIFDHLRGSGIGVNVHYIPVHTQPHYRRMGFCPGMFPVAESYYADAISLPLFATLSDEQQERVTSVVRSAFGLSE